MKNYRPIFLYTNIRICQNFNQKDPKGEERLAIKPEIQIQI